MSQPILRPLGFGEILDGAFTLYRRNLAVFLGTALVPTAALFAIFLLGGRGLAVAMTTGDSAALGGAEVGLALLVVVVALATALLMWGGLTHLAALAYTGQPVSIADGLRVGLGKALTLLGAGIISVMGLLLAALGVFVALVIVLLLLSVLGTVGAVLGQVVAALAWTVVFLAALGAVFAVGPAVVVEGARPLEAVERSFTLARDALPRIVGVMVVALLITSLPGVAINWLTGGFATLMNPDVVPSPGTLMTRELLSIVGTAITTPFSVAVTVLLYFDRRVRTEALDVQMMADRLAPPATESAGPASLSS